MQKDYSQKFKNAQKSLKKNTQYFVKKTPYRKITFLPVETTQQAKINRKRYRVKIWKLNVFAMDVIRKDIKK